MTITPARAFVVLALLAALAVSAFGQDAGKDRVMSVITVEVKGDRDAYLQKLGRLRAIQKRLGVPQFRVWRLTYAGQRTDVIHLMTEYEDLVHFSTASNAVAVDPEWNRVIAEIEAGGTREVASRYLMVDATPAK